MATFVFRDGEFVDKASGEPMVIPARRGVCRPMIMTDVPAHVAPGGIYVGGRAAQRELSKTSGLVPYERIGDMRDAPPGKYDAKCDKWKSWLHDKKRTAAKKAGLDADSLKTEAKIKAALPNG
jgi:transposase